MKSEAEIRAKLKEFEAQVDDYLKIGNDAGALKIFRKTRLLKWVLKSE